MKKKKKMFLNKKINEIRCFQKRKEDIQCFQIKKKKNNVFRLKRKIMLFDKKKKDNVSR